MKKAQAYEQVIQKGDHLVNVTIMVCGPIEEHESHCLFGAVVEVGDGSDTAFALTLNTEEPDSYGVEVYGVNSIKEVMGDEGMKLFKTCFEHFLVNNAGYDVAFIHRDETH